jgi:serine/threonine-protein kinase HipA
MTTLARVDLWGTTIGAVALVEGEQVATFEYDGSFLPSGIELSPLMMPLSRRLYRFPNLSARAFHGLPGLLADCLPDSFGNALIDAWLATQGRTPGSFNAVERLCYAGRRGMGALEFNPATGPRADSSASLHVDRLVALASDVLTNRTGVGGSLDPAGRAGLLTDILRVGTSAGGARAKAVIAWNPKTNEVRSGQLNLGKGFEHWLLKFDGITSNKDKELADPAGYGAIEYAYHRMAVACGIEMADCRLLEEGGRRHFMTRRFDRTPAGDKVHMQSLAALAHLDFDQAGAHGYEQAAQVARNLGAPPAALEQLFLRMVFNVVARNQDDHVKNISFLMDRRGNWRLSPAYDVTYAYQPDGAWTSRHQMTINGQRDSFTRDDFKSAARAMFLKRNAAKEALQRITDVVSRWPDYAEEAGVNPHHRDRITPTLRLGPGHW